MDKRNISRKLAAVTLAAVTAAARTGTAALAESSSGTGTVRKAAVFIRDGEEDTGSEYEAGAYAESITAKKDALEISDLMMSSGSYSFTGIAASGSASTVRMENSTINMSVDEETSGDQAGGDAVTAEDGASVFISDSDLTVEGAGRNVTFVGNNSRLIVNDSTFTSTGSSGNTADIPEPDSNEALLLSGSAQANVSAGNSQTYYYNSTVTAEGWGALCTDPAKEGGSDLYAYNTQAYALDGGYGAGADANCRVWLTAAPSILRRTASLSPGTDRSQPPAGRRHRRRLWPLMRAIRQRRKQQSRPAGMQSCSMLRPGRRRERTIPLPGR